jgi:chromate transporter
MNAIVESAESFSIADLSRYFFRLGYLGFGGPAALVQYMERDLVEEKKWFSPEEFKEGMALAQLSPGPLAAQLAIYLGWVRFKNLGATLCGLCFVLPSFVICVLFAAIYIRFSSMPWLQPVFYVVGAAVIGIIVTSSYKLGKKTIGKNKVLFFLWLLSALITAITENENIYFILGTCVFYLFCEHPQLLRAKNSLLIGIPTLLTGMGGVASGDTLKDIGFYFMKAGTFVFGSGLAIVPFLHSGVVNDLKWLTERQFMDAVAVAMITPGPVVITVAFIGFLVAGFVGALVAAVATFVPCYLFTIIPAPYFNKYAKNVYLKSLITGITVAAVGAIAGACWVLGKRAVTDPFTFIIAAGSCLALFKTKIKEPVIILISAIIGFIMYLIKFH